jgi:branched-chain amino acid transport system substrate-binding protein
MSASKALVLGCWVALVALISYQARGEDIAIAQIGPFTGLPTPDAHEVNAGANAYFAQVNAAGGVNGRRLTLTKFDDQFKGDVFVNMFNAMRAERRYIAMLSPIGSPTVSRLVADKLLDAGDIVVVNAVSGSQAFRDPGHPMLFHVRAGDKAQLERIMTHAKLLDVRSICVLHQDIPIGTAGLQSVNESAKRLTGFTISSVVSKHDDAALVVASASVAKDTAVQAVIVIGSPKFSADAITKLRATGGRHQIYTLSYVPAGLVVKLAGEPGARGVGIVQTFPSPTGRVLKVQRDFQATMQAHAPDVKALTFFHFEGYLSARVLVQGLRKVGARPSAQTLQAGLRLASPMDFDGFTVNFLNSNEGGQWTDLSVISRGGQLRY